ncbi:bifunctional phosphoribosylaminoimidazolecarboxamide formyltransferase/IMP cyclohydrolase [Candidatus Peregrinibacteria bacterium]|nr:bifunctional phosphoribosylaminoimidazolecarboxamide formyltransferase/IMP cyclohydrolase [Candidatus Peregrinibacteria bacterium]
MVKRALISVSNKDGIVEFAKALDSLGFEILSTGGTAKLLRSNDIDAIDVSAYTGFPEMLDGRVKTLHPKIHAALLALRDNKTHMQAAKDHEVEMIDLVVVNLYPFIETVSKSNVKESEAIEQIDIGGPSMLRSAAKNFQSVTVVTDPRDYGRVIQELKKAGKTSLETRRALAEKVFQTTSRYDGAIASWLTGGRLATITAEKVRDLRYGENPHQRAAFYRDTDNRFTNIPNATVLQGKELSYNNIMDADAAFSLIAEFREPTVTFIKHGNPCGIASADTLEEAFINGYSGDPKSAFGGIIAMNRSCTADVAEAIAKQFFELVLAPAFEEKALKILSAKPDVRVLSLGDFRIEPNQRVYRKVQGGLLIQNYDQKELTKKDLTNVSAKKPTDKQLQDLLFAWRVVRHVKSNAIVLAKNLTTVGIGAGQMSRIDSVEIAIRKAGDRVQGAVLASDAFFPFADSIQAAVQAGISAIIQPGGSKRDKEVFDAADKAGIAMVLTGTRAFLH